MIQKKTFPFFLVFTMAVTLFPSCGGDDGGTDVIIAEAEEGIARSQAKDILSQFDAPEGIVEVETIRRLLRSYYDGLSLLPGQEAGAAFETFLPIADDGTLCGLLNAMLETDCPSAERKEEGRCTCEETEETIEEIDLTDRSFNMIYDAYIRPDGRVMNGKLKGASSSTEFMKGKYKTLSIHETDRIVHISGVTDVYDDDDSTDWLLHHELLFTEVSAEVQKQEELRLGRMVRDGVDRPFFILSDSAEVVLFEEGRQPLSLTVEGLYIDEACVEEPCEGESCRVNLTVDLVHRIWQVDEEGGCGFDPRFEADF